MRKSLILAGAAGLAGLAIAGGAAFTGAGLSTSGSAAAPQFIGGTVNQAVTGATLNSVNYTFTDATNTAVDQIDLTFAAGANSRTVAVTPHGAGAGDFTCSVVALNASSCTYQPAAAEAGYAALTDLDVTVS
jgi:hypothetical protein